MTGRATTSKIDESRVQELDELSRKARARREELATRIYTAEADVLQNAPTIRGSKSIMVRNVTGKFAVSDRVLDSVGSSHFMDSNRTMGPLVCPPPSNLTPLHVPVGLRDVI
jgi:hypothetical protein